MNNVLQRIMNKVHYKFPLTEQKVVRSLVARKMTRDWLNSRYQSYSLREKERFYLYYSKIFRDHDRAIAPGSWLIEFAGKSIVLPLCGDQAWLEWDLAVAACGHDLKIKMSYETLIRARRPELFFDIGANYGHHSLLFLAHGIPTVSLEPNPACHDYFRRACELNGVVCDIQPLAIDDEEGWTELWFPETGTWLGTIDAMVKEQISQDEKITSLRVRKTTLDHFVSQGGHRPQLIKIDTEGNEARVLRGGHETLRTCRPLIIFESWIDWDREELLGVLEGAGYRIAALPLMPHTPPTILEPDVFRTCNNTNFLALPAEELEGGRVFWLG